MKLRYFRSDPVFVGTEIYEFLEAEEFKHAIRLQANAVLQESVA